MFFVVSLDISSFTFISWKHDKYYAVLLCISFLLGIEKDGSIFCFLHICRQKLIVVELFGRHLFDQFSYSSLLIGFLLYTEVFVWICQWRWTWAIKRTLVMKQREQLCWSAAILSASVMAWWLTAITGTCKNLNFVYMYIFVHYYLIKLMWSMRNRIYRHSWECEIVHFGFCACSHPSVSAWQLGSSWCNRMFSFIFWYHFMLDSKGFKNGSLTQFILLPWKHSCIKCLVSFICLCEVDVRTSFLSAGWE